MPRNCWEVMKCGRENGGQMALEIGECLASSCVQANGLHQGMNAGRVCWAIAGSYCDNKATCMFAIRMNGCDNCSFYKMVRVEQSGDYKSVYLIRSIAGK